jgi:2'-5' RNA ligase
MNPNWFIAFPVSGDGWFRRLRAPPANVRLLHPDDLHATIAFLGAVSEAQARCAMAALSISLSPLTVTLGSVVPMGNPRHFSALSALVDRGRDELERAMAECRERAWSAARSPRDDRPPKAHVTVARPLRRASDADRCAALEWASSLSLGSVEVLVDRVALYTWSERRGVPGAREFRIVIEQPL